MTDTCGGYPYHEHVEMNKSRNYDDFHSSNVAVGSMGACSWDQWCVSTLNKFLLVLRAVIRWKTHDLKPSLKFHIVCMRDEITSIGGKLSKSLVRR